MHDYCLFLTFKIDSPVRFMLWIKFPDENAKHLFHVALTRRGKADFAPAYFLSTAKISHLALTFLPSCGIRLCLRRTSRLAVDYRGANLYSLYCHRRCSQTVPLSAKCQLGSPFRFWRPFKSPRPPRRLAAAANFFVFSKDYSRRRNAENIFFMRLSVVVKSYLSLVAAFLQKSPARSSQRTPSYAKTVALHIHRSM